MEHEQHLPPLDWSAFFGTWDFRPVWLCTCLVMVLGYLWCARRGHVRGRSMSPVRIACWVLGWVLLGVCLSSAIEAYAMAIFWMHMIEHLTLITVVPALLVLGHPLTVLRDAGGDGWRSEVEEILQGPPVSWLTHPLVGLTAYGVVVFYTHLTPFMDRMVLDPSLMTVEQIAYVVSGCWLMLGAVGDEPLRWQTPYLLRLVLAVLAMIPDTLVGIVLLQTPRDPFPGYMAMRPGWAPDPLHDLDVGASLMWAGGDGLMMCVAIGIVIALLTRQQDRLLGPWLESARTATIVGHVERSGGSLDASEDGVDTDAALDAYNEMLRRLGGPSSEP